MTHYFNLSSDFCGNVLETKADNITSKQFVRNRTKSTNNCGQFGYL